MIPDLGSYLVRSIQRAASGTYLVTVAGEDKVAPYEFVIDEADGVRFVVPPAEYERRFVRSKEASAVYEAILAFHRACATVLVEADRDVR